MDLRIDPLVALAVVATLTLGGCAAEAEESASAEADGARTPASTEPTAKDRITYRTVRVRRPIPFSRDTVRTSTLDEGQTRLDQRGRPGVRVRVVRLALRNGVEVGRDVVRTFVKQRPVQQVRLVGTRVAPEPEPQTSSCDPNYAGACVPVASDVDCAGGSGDGPEYVDGPVTVVGDDVYDLNRDDDNIACDS